jgi:hypothetical protein
MPTGCAKNAFGGYAGLKAFAVVDTLAVLEREVSDAAFSYYVRAFCKPS